MRYPIGIQSFEKIRNGGYVYVDKTDLVYKMVQGHIYFLARPRRFGKSLLVSTLKAYFEGRKDLFEGLKMMELETEWSQYPVMKFDFSIGQMNKENGLRDYLLTEMYSIEKEYDIQPVQSAESGKPSLDVGLRFNHLIKELHEKTGQQVVVLIDEYDKPLLDLLETGNPDDEKQLIANRELLKGFFSVFKAADDHLRFVLLTGITKFSQVSMFSGFNQPDDISLGPRYDTLLGITEEELYTVFEEPIRELAEELGEDEETTKELLKKRYDGYHFSKRRKDVYNPFSILNTFINLDMRDYWFSSGTPSYLVRLLGNTPEDIMQYTGKKYPEQLFIDYKADSAMPLPMIFQAGYLTIKGYDKDFNTYLLDYPNNEVKQGLITLLANDYLQLKGLAVSWVQRIVTAMRDGDLEQVRKLFTAFLAETPYSMRPKKDKKDRELYFHYTFYLLMRLISCYTVYTEKQLSEGRADCIVETPKYVYIFEFKLDGTADEALQQIEDRGYAKAYEADQRPIYIIGVSFSSKTGTIEEWKHESKKSHRRLLLACCIIALSFLGLASCSMIDEDLSDCEQSKIDYELRLITNISTEIETQLETTTSLATEADLLLAEELREHLSNIFTDFAHDVDLSFYDTHDDSLRLQHDQHIMDANQASYTLHLPMREYMHLAVANIVNDPLISLVQDERCHTSRLQQLDRDTIDSHNTGLFTARLPMNVLEGINQSFNVRLYMANCAACLVIDPQGYDTSGIKVYSTGFATDFNICDSAYRYSAQPPIVRTTKLETSGDKIGFCSVSFPSQDLFKTRTVIETEAPFIAQPGEESMWEFRVYMPQPGKARTRANEHVTETIIYVKDPLKPGQLKIIVGRVNPDGSVSVNVPEVSTSVTLDWQPGLIIGY